MLRIGAFAGVVLLGGCRTLGPPDVVFITVDTLRVDHVGAFAADSPARTPHMDALARDGVAFTQAWSAISVTGPSFSTVMTGQLPATHGMRVNAFRGGDTLPGAALTLAEVLQGEGWRTAGFVSGYTLRPEVGIAQGFEVYRPPPGIRRAGKVTVAGAVQYVRNLAYHERAFLWFHTFDPHGPLFSREEHGVFPPDAPVDGDRIHFPPYQRSLTVTDPARYAAAYAARVEMADEQVGRIVTSLRKQDRYRGALIVLLADHGESLTERSLWFDHGFSAHAEQLHVPLIVKLPGNARAGERTDALVSLADVAPTVLSALGLPPLPAADGLDMLAPGAGRPYVLGESSHCKQNRLFGCTPRGPAGKELSARDGGYALLDSAGPEGRFVHAYSRTSDPGERTPRLGLPVPPALVAALDAHRAGLPDTVWVEDPTVEDGAGAHARRAAAMATEAAPGESAGAEVAEEDALRALGYVE